MRRLTERWATARIALLRILFRGAFRLTTRVTVAGSQHIPAAGGCLLVFNHRSHLDTPLLFTLVRRPRVTALVAADYRGRPLFRWFVEAMDGRWLKREQSDLASLREAIRLLEEGWLIGIAPEGTRSKTDGLVEGRPGAAFLASAAGAPVLPIALTGTERIAPALRRLRRAEVSVRIGRPFVLPAAPGPTRQRLQEGTERIMTEIAALLPPEMRGVYAELPSSKPS
jgi:1-acyl-sn-glycerol-3-phosphate acyltransferase